MSAISTRPQFEPRSRQFLRPIMRISWALVRIPAYLLLAMLEPFVSLALTALAFLALLAAVLFHLEHVPHFPLWLMLGFSATCVVTLALYQALLTLLGRSPVR